MRIQRRRRTLSVVGGGGPESCIGIQVVTIRCRRLRPRESSMAPRRTISIVMPVFNTGTILLDSVRSVLAQTLFRDETSDFWELLIVDDASDDPATIEALR